MVNWMKSVRVETEWTICRNWVDKKVLVCTTPNFEMGTIPLTSLYEQLIYFKNAKTFREERCPTQPINFFFVLLSDF